MSRFEGKSLLVPKEVDVVLSKDDVQRFVVCVKGPKGEFTQVLPEGVVCKKEEGALFFTLLEGVQKSFVGLCYRLVCNHLEGVTVGFKRVLEINGVGYRWSVSGSSLQLQLGFSHPISFEIPKDVFISVDKKNTLVIEGIDKQKVGAVAAKIKMFRPVEPYKGKGIRYQGQYVIRKAGKASGK